MDATPTCIHCNATLTAADISTCWCDSCGKRIPSSPKPAPAKLPAAAAAPAGTRSLWVWGATALALLAVGAASVAAFAR